jgi:diguanylate cyclase (GGDEF)-like protein/PAS domain S-box-containing protein
MGPASTVSQDRGPGWVHYRPQRGRHPSHMGCREEREMDVTHTLSIASESNGQPSVSVGSVARVRRVKSRSGRPLLHRTVFYSAWVGPLHSLLPTPYNAGVDPITGSVGDPEALQVGTNARSSVMAAGQAQEFRKHFDRLILLAWTVPPVFGLSFLLFIRMFTPEQMRVILKTPVEPGFAIASLLFAVAYFRRYSRPIVEHLATDEDTADGSDCLVRMRRFPLHFWSVFLAYLVLAPSSVIVSAQLYTDFRADPVDWFRIHLVALIVSILVGLPIFFRMLDLFGRHLGHLALERPHVSIRVKVFLIGALVPLLIDTMIVQYYWTRTGYFTSETFGIWLTLELLAIAGSLMFVSSFGQSLRPLEGVLRGSGPKNIELMQLRPCSTDELGVLTGGCSALLSNLQSHRDILRLSNRLLGKPSEHGTLDDVLAEVAGLCRLTLAGDLVIFVLHDRTSDQLVGVQDKGQSGRPAERFRIDLETPSLAAWVFREAEATLVADCQADPRTNHERARRVGARAAVAAPLVADKRVTGVLLSVLQSNRRVYTDTDLALLEALAGEAARVVQIRSLYRHQAEIEMLQKEREAQVRLLLESTEQGIFGVDRRGRCTFVNRACLRMLGYHDEMVLLGRNMHRTIHHSFPGGEPYPESNCTVRRATERGEPAHSTDEVHWRADGRSFPVEYWSRPIRKDGEIVGAVVSFVDITERKQAERQMHRLSEYNRLLLESTSDGIFGVDRHLRCTFVNRAGASLLGYSPDELLGKDMHALIHHSAEDGTNLDKAQCPIQRTIERDQPAWSDEDVLWRRAGDCFPVQYSANPIHEGGEVTGAVVVFRDVADARAMVKRMEHLASHDPLTGLVNRRELELRLEQAVESARGEGGEHVLCYLDLDQFKIVNDTCGHIAGDELLRQLSGLLSAEVRKSDTIGRLGGDEFGVLLESCPLEKALALIDRLRQVVADYRFTWEGKTFSLGISVGVVAIRPDTPDMASAMRAADAACYMAKEHGRNRVHVYQADDTELSKRQLEMQWAGRIHEAFENDEFVLCFQPILALRKDLDHGLHLEILTHMTTKDGRRVPPGAFLPAAERFQLTSRIDRWVVDETLRCLGGHRDRLENLAMCSINLSGHSLGEPDLLRRVLEQLDREQLPAEKLCFEITETAAVANLSQAMHFIRELSEHGVRFALDDFGSGMSSFAYLKTLPVDFIKIDGNFVRDMIQDPVDRAMVESINQLGHVMGLQTIAEFVESTSILATVTEIGVDYAQGYAVSRPLPLAELPAYLAGKRWRGSA